MTAAVLGAVLGAGLSFAPPPPAQAADWVDTLMDWNPYVGLDVQRTSYSRDEVDVEGATIDSGKVVPETVYGFDMHGGVTPHENFGIETGFFYNFASEKKPRDGTPIGTAPGGGAMEAGPGAKTEFSSWGLSLDALGYYAPLNNNNKNFKLIGTGGVTWTSTTAEGTLGTGSIDEDFKLEESAFGMRFGGGMQFGMTDNTNIRTLVRYQANFNDKVGNAWIYSLGMNYEF
ncbi:MAG: outer membrane beta-barrel protein [Rhodospirillales bacterium]